MTRALYFLLPALALSACGGDTTSTADEAPSPQTASAEIAEAQAPSRDAAPAEPTPAPVSAAPTPTPAPAHDAVRPEAAAILANLGEGFAAADLANGARQFRRCQSCHTLNEGGRHTVGPNLYDVIGRDAAGADRFAYSSQLTDAGLVWDVSTLDAWIENPRALVPGNRMSFVGLRDAEDRRDVIAYIAVETSDGETSDD